MAETALARQLKKLAVPQTTVLIQDKIKKSLLFDHRDAAGLDREVFFSFGTTGLQKLSAVNKLFSKFEADLFSVSYKDFQRSVQNASINEKLNSQITEFLRMLSPYFLLREAHEALEWLIYRFNIHLYNVDDLVTSALPHHNTSIFVRVVQLLDLNEGSRWFWLKSVQKTGVHLEYSAVLNRFISDGGFRKLVCDIAPNALKVFKNHESAAVPVISFSMITIYNALEKCHKVDDKLANSLFPYFVNGLSTGLKKYIAASYMVICKMLMKVKLNFEIIEEFLQKIFSSLTEDLETDACSVLIVAYQTQSVQRLPKKVFSVLIRNSICANNLFSLLNETKSFPLKKAIIKKSINMFNSNISLEKEIKVIEFFQAFLGNVILDSKCVTFCFNFMVKKIEQSEDNVYTLTDHPRAKAAKYVFLNLEHKYPEYFDTAYKSYVESSDGNEILIYKLINKWILKSKYEIVPNERTSLALGLYHANPEVRKTSIKYLLELIQYKNITDEHFAENSLYDRLFDDNPTVVLEILSSVDIVLQVMSKEKLLKAFGSLLTKQIKLNSKWYKVQMKCLDIVIMLFKNNENMFDLFDLILNFIFPVNEDTLEGFIHLLNSNLKNKFIHELQSDLNKDDISSDDIIYINQVIVASLKKVIGQMTENSKVMYISFLNTKITDFKSNSVVFFYVYAMQFMIETSTSLKNCVTFIDSFLQVLKSYFSQHNIVLEKFNILTEQDLIKESIECMHANKFPSSLLYNSLYKIISGLKLDLEKKFNSWSCTELCSVPSYEIISKLFNFCVIFLNSDKTVLQEYFKKILSLLLSCHFKDIQGIFWFLATKLLNTSEDFLVHYATINVASTLSQPADQLCWLFENPVIFFSIVKTVVNPEPRLSHAALNFLSASVRSKGKNALSFLADEIVEKSDEIKTDHKQCLNYVGKWLKPAMELSNGKKAARISKDLQNKIVVFDQIMELLKKEGVPLCMKHFLLSCIVKLDGIKILSSCIPVLNYHMSLLKSINSDEKDIFSIIELLIKKFTPKIAVYLTQNSEELKILLHCLNFTENDANRNVQGFALEILNIDFFSALPSDKIQRDIFDKILLLYMASPFNLISKVENTLAGLCPYAYLFIKHLQEKDSIVCANTTLKAAKKMKKENDSNTETWKKITILLEFMQKEQNFLEKEVLIQELFSLLQKSINYEGESTIEYIKQLILSAINNCYEQLSASREKIMECHFRVEIITLCIRTSTNPKTHHQALLLLNLAASLFPDKVLENVMSIFVFMGSNLVRQDDCYSFQVLSQIIETIMPSLLEASNQQTKTDGFQVVASVIRVFVDSLLDIPGHRQLPLFTKVINTLDPSKYLWLPLAQICDQYATAFNDLASSDDPQKVSPTLEFAISFHQQFSPGIQIDTCISLVKFLLMLPDSKKQLETNPDNFKKIKEPFDLEARSDKQLHLYKQNVLCYMKLWLTSPIFYTQVAELSSTEQNNLEEKYEQLLETMLGYLQNRLDLKNSAKDDIKVVTQVQLLYDLVHAVNSILPSQLFIRTMRQLLKNNDLEVQLRAIELLNTKLEQLKEITHETKESLFKLLKRLLKIVNKCLLEENKDDKNITIQQTLLYSLHLLCKLLRSDYSTKLFKVLKVTAKVLTQYHRPELKVNALLCIAQLCYCLRENMLPHLNSFMPSIISILQDKNILDLNECLLLGITSALNSIFETLGKFLSKYMEDIIVSISLYSECNKKAISESFLKLQTKVASEIELRVIIRVIPDCYVKLSREDPTSVTALMNILTQSLNATYKKTGSNEDILDYTAELQNIYITLLDFRNCNSSLPAESVNSVEDSIISSLKTFVMKLPVTRFKTCFQKIYQWATVSNDDQEPKFRIFTFYKMTCEFSKSLNRLFSFMSRYFFNHISTILSSCNFPKSEVHYFEDNAKLSHELLINAVDTLKYCFMYSEEQLIDKENFDTLMQPLVDQIENLHNEAMYQELVELHLSSCIAYFMGAISDSSLLRSLNYQIMLKTRNDSPKIRFGTLQVILDVVNKMGDNYRELLPESVAFLYELMEDESTEVEQECQTLITEMKRIFGEDIMSYFK